VDHHHRQRRGVLFAELDDMQTAAGHIDHPPRRPMRSLDQENAGLRDRGQHQKRHRDADQTHTGFPEFSWHWRDT
jgi:hypothetical protein